MIELTDLGCRARGRWVFRGVSLRIAPGEVFGLTGPNGSGKSLLLGICATLVQPSAGSARVGDADVRTQRGAVRRIVGFVPEDVGWNPRMTVREDLDFFAAAHGLTRSARRVAVDDGLRRWGLAPSADEAMSRLTRGLTRRVALARAWLHRPRVVLLDDPSSGLDGEGQATLWRQLELHALGGGSALVVSYDARQLARVARCLGVLAGGALSEVADVRTLGAIEGRRAG